MQRYFRISQAIDDLPFLIFTFLDNKLFSSLVPRRRRAHQDVDAFLSMIDGVIERKRALLKDSDSSDIPQNEKDLLTLLIEAESDENGYMTNEELRVSQNHHIDIKQRGSLIC